jgi:hypothetical protein
MSLPPPSLVRSSVSTGSWHPRRQIDHPRVEREQVHDHVRQPAKIDAKMVVCTIAAVIDPD